MLTICRNNLLVQYAIENQLYASEDHLVWKSIDDGKNWQEVCRIPPCKKNLISEYKDRFLRSYLVRKLRKNIGINNVVVLPSETVIIQYDNIYRYSGSEKYASAVFYHENEGIAPPLKNGLCYDSNTEALYFGEYICERPSSIRVVRGTNDGQKWEVCYTFPEGRIRHIHAIIPDQYRKRLWICTGDSNQESCLFYTDDGFKTVQLFGGGDQSWRMVSLIPTQNALYWGSDAGGDSPPGTSNYIYRYDMKSGNRMRLAEIGNPAYYSMRNSSGLYIASTYEPHKSGPCTKAAELWFSKNGKQWKMISRLPYKKNSTHHGTIYGMIVLPTGQAKSIFITPLNTEKHHFHLLKLNGNL